MEVREVYRSKLPQLLKTDGVTLGRTIYYRRSEKAITNSLRRHEMTHIKQYEKYGILGFMIRYLASYIKNRLSGMNHHTSYLNIPLEIEARLSEYKIDSIV